MFDVDGTLLTTDSLVLLARQLHRPWRYWQLALLFLPFWLGLKLRLIPAAIAKERFLSLFITSGSDLERQVEGSFQDLLLKHLRPAALRRLRWHQQQGHRVILCSASPRFYLQLLADALDVELVATELQRSPDGLWQPRLASPNCKGAEKVRRLQEYLGTIPEGQVEAYGDSAGDRELLQWATIPHYRSFGPEPRPYPPFTLGPLLPVVAVSLFAYGLLGVWSQGDQLLPILGRLWPQILTGLMLVLLGYALRYGRWRLLLHQLRLYPPIRADARIWMGSYAFTATPGKSGEAVRSLLLRETCGIPATPTLMALVVERITDGTAVLVLLLLNLPLLFRWQVPILLPLSVLLGIALPLGWLGRRPRRQGWLTTKLQRRLPGRLAHVSGDSLQSLRQLMQPTPLLLATGIGVVAWSLEGLALWLLLQGLGSTSISAGGAILAHTSAGLLGALSLLPGGLGSTEAGTVGLLTLQGVGVAVATPAALLIRLMTLWFATGLGVVFLIIGKAFTLDVPKTNHQ
ncbi:flippase-like domain-containing protein [Synechococcus elongatus IITB7]|uniref:flippase-like domain-containing protein n=1 Tax=Synechococcus elongatus TaxID=32046 RepID=UPI0030D3F4F5